MQEALSFTSPEGHQIVRGIIRKALYDPHDYQLEGVCKALDGVDLLSVIATGSGKTGYLLMYMLAILALQDEPSVACKFARRFPVNPAMVIVYPTNGLEEEMVRSWLRIIYRRVITSYRQLYSIAWV